MVRSCKKASVCCEKGHHEHSTGCGVNTKGKSIHPTLQCQVSEVKKSYGIGQDITLRYLVWQRILSPANANPEREGDLITKRSQERKPCAWRIRGVCYIERYWQGKMLCAGMREGYVLGGGDGAEKE